MRRRHALRLLLAAPALACGQKGLDATPPPSPRPAPAPAAAEPARSDRYVERVAALRERLPAGRFSIHVEEPFVVIGEGEASKVQAYATQIVRWSVDRLRKAYFDTDPAHVIDIWLFADAESYERNALALFGEPPSTPYGWYSSRDRALVMNIATGGGTLVHEIVHPLMEANFPACPAWFNEGLASLYEQCAEREGEIVGLTNWRLAGLQEALDAGRVPGFAALCASGDGFYDDDPGTNYAQARYLCYWLQEHGRLRAYYRSFRSAHAVDPTGLETLRASLGRELADFEGEWGAWVSKLRYPA